MKIDVFIKDLQNNKKAGRLEAKGLNGREKQSITGVSDRHVLLAKK